MGRVAGMSDVGRGDGFEDLHREILQAWNRRDAPAFACCFADDAVVIGFDGSDMIGPAGIAEQLASMFADHEVATYVRIVRRVEAIDDHTALLHAVVSA